VNFLFDWGVREKIVLISGKNNTETDKIDGKGVGGCVVSNDDKKWHQAFTRHGEVWGKGGFLPETGKKNGDTNDLLGGGGGIGSK